jgi:hypothetical protein
MAWVRAVRECYTDQVRAEGEEFEYSGPDNANLEPVDEAESPQKGEPASREQKPAKRR